MSFEVVLIVVDCVASVDENVTSPVTSDPWIAGVLALDSLGFGRSAKPPLVSYDQYLWRDQALRTLQATLTEHYQAGTL